MVNFKNSINIKLPYHWGAFWPQTSSECPGPEMGVFHINLTSWFQIRPPFGDLRRENGHFCILNGVYKDRIGCFYALKLLKMSQYTFGVVWNTLKIITERKKNSPFLLYTWKFQNLKKSKRFFFDFKLSYGSIHARICPRI